MRVLLVRRTSKLFLCDRLSFREFDFGAELEDREETWPANAAFDRARCHAVTLLLYPSGFVCF